MNFCKEMILNGKAKEDFFNWLDNQGVNGIDISNWEFEKFHLLSNVSQNSLITEWFDSVGIYISINYVDFYDELRNNTGFETYVTNKGLSVKFRSVSSRQEATIQAIKKANEIYNTTL